MTTSRILATALLVSASLTLAGCGLKGDLYIPAPEPGAGDSAPIEQPRDTIVNERTDEPVGSSAEDGLEEVVD